MEEKLCFVCRLKWLVWLPVIHFEEACMCGVDSAGFCARFPDRNGFSTKQERVGREMNWKFLIFFFFWRIQLGELFLRGNHYAVIFVNCENAIQPIPLLTKSASVCGRVMDCSYFGGCMSPPYRSIIYFDSEFKRLSGNRFVYQRWLIFYGRFVVEQR